MGGLRMITYSGPTQVDLKVNDHTYTVTIEPQESLLYVLRDKLGLTGTRIGCENGDCGACTILLDGKPHKACMLLAIEVQERSITTIEGLNNTTIQQAFLDYHGFQCGFCTSGFIMNAFSLMENKPNATDEEVDTWLKSNLCRCTGYDGIKRAVKSARMNDE